MSLPQLCIKRPVFTTMLVALPIVLGLVGYSRMGVDLMPNIEMPVVTVRVNRPGASVEEMETGVTKVIEEAVNTIAGIDELRSTTREGSSFTMIQFILEKNRDIAQQEVQSKINTILSRLPTGTQSPVIDKFDADSRPVITISVAGERSMREITDIAETDISEAISSLNGVGAVSVRGGQRRAVNVTIDTDKLEAYGVSIAQVKQALASQNLELPGGRVDQTSRELVLRTMGRISDIRQFNDVIVANVGGQPIRIRDLGDGDRTVQDTWEESRSLARLDGNNAVSVAVQKQSGTNTVQVIDAVKAKLAELAEAFAQEGKSDIKMQVIRDDSRFINASMHEVKKHLILGALLVSGTILLFLRDWRTMVIASLAIPTSLIASFSVMYALGFTINNITMLAMVLAVGIVIDDAVVILENIFRWMEERGSSAWDAAVGATKEIGLAVTATTFSLVVIFLPIAFMQGRVGRMFYSFGISTAVAILVSLLVSFTMTPMLCSRFLKLSRKATEAQKHGHSHHSGGVYGWLAEKPYLLLLRWAMRHRWAVVLTTLLVTASIFPIRSISYPGLFGIVGFELIPRDDQGEIEVNITTPEGWTLERTDRLVSGIERRLRQQIPGIVNVLTTVGDSGGRSARGEGNVTQASIYLRLVDLEDRPQWLEQRKARGEAKADEKAFTQFEVMGIARRIMADYPDLRSSVQAVGGMGGGGGGDIDYSIVGPDIQRLLEYSERMLVELRAQPGLVDVDTTLALRKPELRVIVNRDRASDLGVSIQTIASTLRTLVGGEIVSDYKDNQSGEQYDVWLRARGTDRNDRRAVANLTIPSITRGLVRMENVANLAEDRGPAQIDRLQRLRKITLVANLQGIPMDVAAGLYQRAFDNLNAPADYHLMPGMRAKMQNESYGAFILAFGFSLVFMYMILAAQFESFVYPITILLAVPLTIPFALISLIALGQPLSLFSMLGLFLLFGIVKKNGILQVDYTNVLRQRAADSPVEVPAAYRDAKADPAAGWFGRWMASQSPARRVRLWAILEANRVRLRPILMTTCMLIAGMIPIAIGTGPGSATRASMAKVIVGGQALSLLLSLLVTPVAYSLFDDLRMWWRRALGSGRSARGTQPEQTSGVRPDLAAVGE